MGVLISNQQNRVKVDPEIVRRQAQNILDALDYPDDELSLLIVDDPFIADLNQTYLNRTGPTNVIAFPMREGEFNQISPYLIGDVVISVETTRREADMLNVSFEQRFLELLIHGILHLYGYDHESNEADSVIMERKSEELYSILTKHDPD